MNYYLLLHVNSSVYLLKHLFQRCFVTCLRRYVRNLLPVLKHLKVITNHVLIDQESKFQLIEIEIALVFIYSAL